MKLILSQKSSLLGQVFCFKDEEYNLNLPRFSNALINNHYIVWKINIKKISSKNCFVKFIIKEGKKKNKVSYY